jgi:hypothetical protein
MLGLISSFLLYWYADAVLQLPRPTIQTLIFLKLVVAGHSRFTSRATNVGSGPIHGQALDSSSPARQRRFSAGSITVYGIFIQPIGWKYALAVWAYALAWLPIASAVEVGVRRLVDLQAHHQVRNLVRIEAPRTTIDLAKGDNKMSRDADQFRKQLAELGARIDAKIDEFHKQGVLHGAARQEAAELQDRHARLSKAAAGGKTTLGGEIADELTIDAEIFKHSIERWIARIDKASEK